MRPISLSMQAFGPFAGTEEILFEKLGAHPLFLINGPTGSGKTTILDAVCFALYGKSTGDEREAPQMRCDYAEPGILTEVSFTFELSDRTYRIRRIPEQERPKSRGEGTTVEKPSAELVELKPDGSERLMVSRKVNDATEEIENLTGLNADQFRQVMVLPQGKFRQLLMAESKEREQIFSRLFQTRIYKKLENTLKDQAADIRRQIEKLAHKAQGILESHELETMESLSEEIESLKPEWEKTRQEKEACEKKHLEATSVLQSASSLHKQFSELEESRNKQAEMLAKQPEIDLKRQQVVRTEAAIKLKPVHSDLHRCRKEAASAAARHQQAGKEKTSAREQLDIAEKKLKTIESLETKRDGLKQAQSRLEGYRERSERYTNLGRELAASEKADREAVEALQKSEEALKQLIKTGEEAEQELKRLQESQSVFTDRKLAHRELAEKLAAHSEMEDRLKKLEQTQNRLNQLELTGRDLKQASEASENEVRLLEIRWHHGQAALLARELEDGVPCPVCGSLDHPSPSVGNDAIPSDMELDQARQKRTDLQGKLLKARESYTEIRAVVTGLQKEMDQIREKLGPLADAPRKEIEQQCKSADEQVKKLQKEQEQIRELNGLLDSRKLEIATGQKTVESARTQSKDRQAALNNIRGGINNLEAELPAEFRIAVVLEENIKAGKREIEKLDLEVDTIRKTHQETSGKLQAAEASLKAADEHCQAADRAASEAAVRWNTAILASVFESDDAYGEAVVMAEQMPAIKQELEAWDTLVNQLKGAVKQQEAALKDQSKPDIAALEKKLQESGETKKEAEKAWQICDKRLSQLQSARKKLLSTIEEKSKLEQHYALVGTLSDIANGQTGNKISLQRFVLSVLLDDVLLEASRRLKVMSRGRYQLQRREDRTKGNRASGLELEIEDAWSGKMRPAATLSGGESFMAALALALGLSDVVQAYAGGIRLDTLFIDEGFGSLDPEALDLAIRTLVDLQSSGRMIGIISHVSDLREQIPTRLDVEADRRGSRIRLVSTHV